MLIFVNPKKVVSFFLNWHPPLNNPRYATEYNTMQMWRLECRLKIKFLQGHFTQLLYCFIATARVEMPITRSILNIVLNFESVYE